MKYFKNKTLLITGAASGIGRLIVKKLADWCNKIIVLDINEQGLNNLKNELASNLSEIIIYKCDLSRKDDIKRTSEIIIKKFKKIDILINNAGIVSGKQFLECSDAQIEKTIAVNIMAPMWLVKEFLPGMIKENSGHIINISSAGGIIGTAGLSDYAASKFALFGFDESIRVEMRKNKYNISTTIVCPYYINTGMFNGVKTRAPWLLPILKPEKVVNKIVNSIKKRKKRLYVPWIVYIIPFVRLFPTAIFDIAASLLGVHDSMNEFKGH